MKKWIFEGLSIVSVTTLFPLGWGLRTLKKNIPFNSQRNPEALLCEHEQPVLLVHGIFHNATAFYEIEKMLRKARFSQIHGVNLWTSLNHIEDLAGQLQLEAEQLIETAMAASRYSNGNVKLRIVAHSLGGLITRVALLDPDFARRVDKVIFLGTPHQGVIRYDIPFPRVMSELKKNSQTIRKLQSEPMHGSPRYYNLRAGNDLVTPKNSTFLPHVHDRTFDDVGHLGLLTDYRVLNSVVEILESPFYDHWVESQVG